MMLSSIDYRTTQSKNQFKNHKHHRIEFYIRNALAFGALSSQAEAEINRLATLGNLSPHECTLLAVLRDSIQEGHIRRV
jgi:hypothetical protein